MPTRNRAKLVEQACAYFRRQRYPNKELIIVADGESVKHVIRQSDRIRLVEVPDLRTIGEKRNMACAFATGEIIMQWDDDDWYGPDRISVQVRPIIESKSDITGLTCDVLLDLAEMQFWTCTAQEHSRVFGQVASGTLAFRASVWRNLTRYPHQSVAEDAVFLQEAMRRGARFKPINGQGQFVYVRHESNTWRMDTDSSCWSLVRRPFRRRDHRFYASLNKNDKKPGHISFARMRRRETPFVSCIMPTSDRPGFVQLALKYYLRQDYPKRELVIVDDGQSSVEHLVGKAENIRYIRVAPGLSLGHKRNLACEEATGKIICHWDDDDWYSPARLSYQVRELNENTAQVCGLSKLMFFDTRSKRAWRYFYELDRQAWLAGASLCYRRESWLKRPFENLDTGEDNRFVSRFKPDEVARHEDISFFVGMIHKQNTSPKNFVAPAWTEIQLERVQQAMGRDFENYTTSTS